MRKSVSKSAELVRERPSSEPQTVSDNPTFAEWQATLLSVLKSVEPISPGLAYSFGMAMHEQNPEFFEAMTNVVLSDLRLRGRLGEKLSDHQAMLAAEKTGKTSPYAKITFEDLCETYGLRGRVRSLMSEFKEALTHSKESLSDFEKEKLSRFIGNVEAMCQPVNYKTPAATFH